MQNPPSSTGRPLEFDPEKARDAIMRLFWEKGFAAVSLPDLEKRTGLSRSSLYNTFGSKPELFRQTLARYRETISSEMCRPLEQGERGLADLLAFLDAAATQFADRSGVTGCLLVNSMAEFGGEHDEVNAHGSGHLARLRDGMIATLERAAALGELPREHLPEKADLVIGLLLGITVAARAGLSPDTVSSLVDAARTQIRAWATPAARRRLRS